MPSKDGDHATDKTSTEAGLDTSLSRDKFEVDLSNLASSRSKREAGEDDEEHNDADKTAASDGEHDPYYPPIITLPEVRAIRLLLQGQGQGSSFPCSRSWFTPARRTRTSSSRCAARSTATTRAPSRPSGRRGAPAT